MMYKGIVRIKHIVCTPHLIQGRKLRGRTWSSREHATKNDRMAERFEKGAQFSNTIDLTLTSTLSLHL